MTPIIDTTYTGPDDAYRTDARFQLDRALADMEMCRSLMIHGDDEQRALAERSLPAVKARIAAWTR